MTLKRSAPFPGPGDFSIPQKLTFEKKIEVFKVEGSAADGAAAKIGGFSC